MSSESLELGLVKPTTQPGHANALAHEAVPVGKIALTPGTIVGGYRIERQLAEGGMGTVYIAEHTILPRRAAIKVLRPELTDTPLARDSLLQEGRILETLLDPRIARVYDAGFLEAGRPWVAMELLSGECLADLVVRQQTMSVPEVARLVGAIVDALSAAHLRGVVHSDVKPENIIVQDGPLGIVVKMIDWGIARIAAHTKVEPFAVGTPHYMAPEQVRGEPIDHRADIYALGVLTYELLAGKTPFNGETPADIAVHHLRSTPVSLRSLRKDVPPAIESLVHAMLAKDAAARPTLETVRACFGLVSDAQLMSMDEQPEAQQAAVTRSMKAVEIAADVPAPDDDALEMSVEVNIDYSTEEGDDVAYDPAPHPRWTPPHGRPATGPLSMRETMRFQRAITSNGARKAAVGGMIRKAG